MRRSYRKRHIHQPPFFKNFKPSGIPRNMLKKVTLTVDEYEAIRLADYNGFEHQQAAQQMNISRPTFTRLIEKARHIMARTIVEGMELVVEGGNIEFENTLCRCRDCGEEQISPYNEDVTDCPECGSENVEDLAHNFFEYEKSLSNKQKENPEKMTGFEKRNTHRIGHGQGQKGGGGRNKGGAFGPGGYCVCAKCGEKIEHQPGIKCTNVRCPKCGHAMVREELLNKKRAKR